MGVGDPRWTARIEEDEGAQDPLAMNRVTDRLLEDLLPGITTISPRPRYIAHHLWALKDVAESESPDSGTELMQGLYRRERIFLLSGARHAQSDTNRQHTDLVGARTANKLVKTDTGSIDLDFSFSSNRSGSYGRNYVGPLQTMGLVDTPEDADFEAPTNRGETIADAYRTLAAEINLTDLANSDRISLDRLDAIASELCPCAVSVSSAPDREPLRALYLGRNPPKKFATQARTRRESLALILHLARLGNDAVPLREQTLLNATYYRTVLGEEGPVDAQLPAGVEDTAARWKAFRAHDYFSYATEALLTSWLAYLKQTEEADTSLKEFKQQVQSEQICERITDRIDQPSLTSDTPLSTVLASIWPDATHTTLRDNDPITPVPISHAVSEHTLDAALQTALSNRNWKEVHATWPCLLLALSLRFDTPSGKDAVGWEWLRSHTRDDLSPVRLREHLVMHLEQESSWGEFIDWFIDKYLITRATEVAAGKSDGRKATRGYFKRTAAGWRHVRDHTPRHWGARFDSAVSVLRDLALLDPDPSTAEVTAAGNQLVENLEEI